MRDRREGLKNAIKAISRIGEKLNNTKSMDTYELIELLMYKINKMMPRKCEECAKYYNEPNNPLNWPTIKCDTCSVSAHMCLQSASPYVPFIYEDNQSLIKMMGFKWRCHECNHLFEENKMSNLMEDKIMKESIRKHRMLRRSARTTTGNSLEKGTAKTPDPSIT